MQAKPEKTTRRTAYFVILPVLAVVLAWGALILPLLANMLSPSMVEGDVAAQDILAPSAANYTSEVMTEQRREAAARAVAPVYTRVDNSIARQQLEHLRSALNYINSVRADAYASPQQKINDLAALEDVHLEQDTAASILAMSDARWQSVQQEALRVLEDVMRTTIRAENLEDTRSGVPEWVSFSVSLEQAGIIEQLVVPFVVANSEYSESLTETARQQARDSVTPVTRRFRAGERVVQRGQVLSSADVEALRQLGLAQPELRWEDPASAAGIAILLLAFLFAYLYRHSRLSQDARSITLIVVLFLLFLTITRLVIPGHTILPYAFPLAAYGLVISAMFGMQLALILSLPLAVMAAYGLPNVVDLTTFYLLTSLFGILALGRARRLTSFLWAGGAIGGIGILVILAYRLGETDWVGLATLSGAALFYGAASTTLAVVLQFFLAQFTGATTPMQLMDLSRPDHPLLQMILREAPGTYQHSLQVANLAEQAAERIGADPLLTRVGAMYHDVGKALNPMFFIENQVPGFPNPHDELDPLTSSQTIIRHVTDGVDLARKNHLPKRIVDFIVEHHGSMVTRYQYVKAVKAAGGDEALVDDDQFRYPGPRPQSRETAILMLADGSEARMRAERPTDYAELRRIVKSVIENRVSYGQLDDTDLTLRDLDQIAESFTATLRGIYHPRVKYPQLQKGQQAEPAMEPEAAASPNPETPSVPLAGSVEPTRPISTNT